MTLQKDPKGTETHQLGKAVDFHGKRVLEIGSGEGRLTWRYARAARRVLAIDPDLVALQVAAADRPADLKETVVPMGASSLDLPFRRASFDIAVLAWSF
jgi:ubiquinone/menaquinone biosynthesis C-methylase UbiE